MAGTPAKSVVFDEFFQLVSGKKHYKARGWINVNCPSCGDRRQRGGFAPTNTGGFRYFCQNGGCDYHDRATGWEPGKPFAGRVRRLFDLLGGDISRIPMQERVVQPKKLIGADGKEEVIEVSKSFPAIELPKRSQLLVEAAETDKRAAKVLEYLRGRWEYYPDYHPFMWSELSPNLLIIPYCHHDKIVGYLGRDIRKAEGPDRFTQRSSPDYIFNQDLISEMGKYVLVVESPMDAIALRCLGIRSSRLTKKQINLLRTCGKEPILIPDHKGQEWAAFVDLAESQKWLVSVPEWGKNIKDPGESMQRYGLLWTVQQIMDAKNHNYPSARVKLNLWSKD